jgi:hypothetical protein
MLSCTVEFNVTVPREVATLSVIDPVSRNRYSIRPLRPPHIATSRPPPTVKNAWELVALKAVPEPAAETFVD